MISSTSTTEVRRNWRIPNEKSRAKLDLLTLSALRRFVHGFPKTPFRKWEDPDNFRDALLLHTARNGDTYYTLHKALAKKGDKTNRVAVRSWLLGAKLPRLNRSWYFLNRVESRYGLPAGYFKSKIKKPKFSARDEAIQKERKHDRPLLRWHLPNDFDSRSLLEQDEILAWYRKHILGSRTKYSIYMSEMCRQWYRIKFPDIERLAEEAKAQTHKKRLSPIKAAPQLAGEMLDYVQFKTSRFAASGFLRGFRWRRALARIRIQQFGCIFGALAASPDSIVAGLGVNSAKLTFGLLLFPGIWDWWLLWREKRRGFFVPAEKNFLYEAKSLTHPHRGWVKQHPELAERLFAIDGIISHKEIVRARQNWAGVCNSAYNFFDERIRDVGRLVRKHREPFETILPILEADSPLSEYRKIADEILKWMPEENESPRGAAKAVRSYLIMRFCMHSGLRPRNLRELLFCPRGASPRPERDLEDLQCGELRWSDRANGWEIFIPAVGFKNANSSFFLNSPYRLLLPNLANLYPYIDAYIERHRAVLLGKFKDPSTFFVRSAKYLTGPFSYDGAGFYSAYRRIIQLHGIFNPHTGRGAIASLMPHGPHNARDILATHILKRTGSFTEASYAIQSTPAVVEKCYARFVPEDKTAQAAKILNEVWKDAK